MQKEKKKRLSKSKSLASLGDANFIPLQTKVLSFRLKGGIRQIKINYFILISLFINIYSFTQLIVQFAKHTSQFL